jgi:WD40 repeat protein
VPDVFISYSRRDKHFVDRLNQALEARGKDAWVDVDDIPVSAQWLKEIQDGIDASDAFLVVLSPDSLVSAECTREVDLALARRKRILPIVFRDVDPADVRPEVASINWVYLREQDQFEPGLDTLVKALETDLDHVKAHTHLANQAIDWDRAGRDRARLLRGSELQDAERWLTEAATKDPGPTEVQAQFVQASRDASRRRGRMLFSGVAVALVIAVALAIVALIQRSNAIHQSQIAYSRQLDADAQNQYTNDPELGVLLAVKAAEVAPSAQTRDALREALGQSRVRYRYTNPKGPIGDALWSPDGTRLLIADEGADQAEIVRPGAAGKPIMLPAPGLDSQIGWGGRRGQRAITGGAEVNIWNGVTGTRTRRLPTRAVDVALSPDGNLAATADVHGLLHIWDVKTGRQLSVSRPATNGAAHLLLWSPDGSMLAEDNLGVEVAGAALGTKSIPDTLTIFSRGGRRLVALREPDLIDDFAFSPDSSRIALATLGKGLSGATQVFAARTGKRLLRLAGAATAVAFSPDGTELAYAQTRGNLAYVYTFADHQQTPLVGNAGTINSIQFSHTGTYVVTSADDTTARVFNSFFGTPLEVLYGHAQAVTDAGFNLDDSLIATASQDTTARVWTTPAPHALAHLLTAQGQYSINLSPDGTTILEAGPASSTGLLLDSSTLRTKRTLTPPPGQAFGGAAFRPDGHWLAVLAGPAILEGTPPEPATITPRELFVYDWRTGRVSARLAPNAATIQYADLDRHGHLVTLWSNGEVDLWSPSTGRRIRQLLPAGKPAQTVVLSPTGTELAVTYPSDLVEILTTSGRLLHRLQGPPPQGVVTGVPSTDLPVRALFSPNGRWLVSLGADKLVHIWNLSTGRQVRTLGSADAPSHPFSAVFSSDGRLLATGDSAWAYVWRFPSGQPVGGPFKHQDPSTYGDPSELGPVGGVRVAFGQDGKTLVTTGDTTTQVWSVENHQSVFDLQFSFGASLTPDARRIVANYSGTLSTFSCELCGGLGRLLATAKRDVTRGLTTGERALYLRRN